MHFKSYLKYFSLTHYIRNKWLLWFVRCMLALVFYIFLLESNFLFITGPVPALKDIKNPQVAIASDIYSADSVLLGRYYIENRTPVSYNEMSPWLTSALVATEDARFYKHHGLDLFALAGSVWQTAQGDQRGGSTITQQLVKNIFKTRAVASQGLLRHVPGVRTFVYKTKEWLTALKLEFYFSKNDILELYLNSVDFGNNWFGVKVASNNYFSKPPLKLQAEEAAMLIGMLKATTTYNPKRNKTKSLQRRNVVLAQMAKYNYISVQQSDSLQALPLKLNLRKLKKTESDDSYIRQYVEKLITPWCIQNKLNLYEDGLKIYTTINAKLQRIAEESLTIHTQKLQKQFNEQWRGKKPWIDDNGVEIKNFIEQQLEQTTAYADLMQQFKNNSDSAHLYLHKTNPMKIFSWKGPIDTTFSSYDSLKYY
ncbi:MAG TPA: transglycosylase domain-containing protein, partial [Bacteroidia bacterium]|nr:transglycosylase domain-containing protein [Bacteroidia bacterium]